MVRRRRDQRDAGRGVPGLRDPRIDLLAGQMTAFAGFGALCHFDLDLHGAVQIFFRYAEPARGDLLDRAVLFRAETRRILAAFPGVGLSAEPVHGERQRLMRFFGDRAVGHGAGLKAAHDVCRRFDFRERNRIPCRFYGKE